MQYKYQLHIILNHITLWESNAHPHCCACVCVTPVLPTEFVGTACAGSALGPGPRPRGNSRLVHTVSKNGGPLFAEWLNGNINVSSDAIDGDAKLLKAESPVPKAAAEHSSRVRQAKHMHMHMHAIMKQKKAPCQE